MSEPSPATLQFLGAAGTVTGSRYLIEHAGARILVDCGLFQGYKQLRERNRAPFAVPPASIDAVLLTHAHLDHSGYLPALVAQGFKGPVICTAATRDLCQLLLPDSGHLLEEEADFARRHGYSRHAIPRPLYTEQQARASLRHFQPADFFEDRIVAGDIGATFLPAGHILGAAQLSLRVGTRRLHFSGDLGRPDDPLMHPPARRPECDVLVCESTYGDRSHGEADPEAELAPIVRRVAARGGVIVVPAFAIGRAQSLMLHLSRLRRRGEIPPLPIYLNSPMAAEATDLYRRHRSGHRLSDEDCRHLYELVHIVRSVEESKALNRRRGPMIIISASGMATGGRVLHHLAAFGPDPRNAILLAGYQAGGTRGASLASGERTLRIFGNDVPIRAEVAQLRSASAHADGSELLDWMREGNGVPAMTYITHGEPNAADTLRRRVRHELGWECRVPEHLERVALGAHDPA